MDIHHILQRIFVVATIILCLLLAVLFGAIQAGVI